MGKVTKFQRAPPHPLMMDLNTSGCQHLLKYTQAERKPEVQPNGLADHFSRTAVTCVARMPGLFQNLAHALAQL